MKLDIKLIDTSLPAPEYQTEGAVAFDLYVREETIVEPFKPTLIPLNIVVKTPPGYFFLLAARSSLPLKKNLMVANSIGIIDQDYCGEEDEIKLQVLNFTQEPIKVEKGERIAQGMVIKIDKVEEFVQHEKMSEVSRGGFGSTGGHK
jgi:dUTP pyrophosphatase